MWVICGLWDGVALLLSTAHVDWITNATLGVPTATNDASLAVAVQMDRVIPSLPTGPITAPSRACPHIASLEPVCVRKGREVAPMRCLLHLSGNGFSLFFTCMQRRAGAMPVLPIIDP